MVRMTTRLRIVLSCLLVSLLVASLGGCTNVTQGGTCVPGASMVCACPAGQQGTQTCTSASTFAACVCSVPTVDAGGGGGGEGVATSLPDATAVGGDINLRGVAGVHHHAVAPLEVVALNARPVKPGVGRAISGPIETADVKGLRRSWVDGHIVNVLRLAEDRLPALGAVCRKKYPAPRVHPLALLPPG